MLSSINQLMILNGIDFPILTCENHIKDLVEYLGIYFNISFKSFEEYTF